MRKTALICIPFILSGCSLTDESTVPPPSLNDNFAYDERDAIPNDTPLPKPGINQRPVVGTKKMLVSVIKWQDGDILNKPLIERHTLSSDPDSLKSYILAASHGKLTLAGQVISYTSGPRPEQCKSGQPMPLSLATSEGRKAAEANGLNPGNFDYLINVIDCGGAASAYMPGRIIGVYGQSASPHVYKHEFGHSLGYSHGKTYTKCPQDGETVRAPNECTTIGYGDTGDSVSGGGTLYPANNRWYSGWLDQSQSAVIERSGLYRLGVLGQGGPQLYRINRTGLTPSQIALEYRKPTIYDDFPPTDNRVNGVWVRFTTMGNNVSNIQLDATPESATTVDPAMQPGRVLKDDTAGITVRVCTTSVDGATVAIAINGETSPPCPVIGLPLLPPGIQTPASGAPATPNPVTFQGTSIPGAGITLSYTMSSKNSKSSIETTTADATGVWRITLPSLPPGIFNAGVIQEAGNSTSLINFRWFEVAR